MSHPWQGGSMCLLKHAEGLGQGREHSYLHNMAPEEDQENMVQ